MCWAVLFLTMAAVCLEAAETVRRPFPGVIHIVRSDSTPRPYRMHVVKIDLATPGLRFKVSPRGGAREAVRQTTLDYLKQEKAQIGVNLHFFLPFPSSDPDANLVGLAASEGDVYSGFETPDQSYALVANAPAIHLDRDNRASFLRPESLQGASLWNAFSGSAQIITEGAATIPFYRDEEHPGGQLTPGGPEGHSNDKSWYVVPNARTVAGLSADSRTLYLITIDKSRTSEGLSLMEAAEILVRDYGVYNALNMDGGGSTTLAMEDPRTHERAIVNMPSAAGRPRTVATSLAAFVPLDSTAPSTAYSFSAPPDGVGVFPRNLSIELRARDDAAGTGVEQIFLSIAAEQAATLLSPERDRAAIILTSPGSYEIRYFARDYAGNEEAPKSISIRIAQ